MNTLSTRLIVIWLTLFVALVVININTYGKERIIRDGQPVLLELAPVDPRSLMQGDYMILDYDLARKVYSRIINEDGYFQLNAPPRFHIVTRYRPEEGTIVVQLDENNVATFARLHTPDDPSDSPKSLADNEVLLKYGAGGRWQSVSFGADNYFFQEGTADLFQDAQYGELRVKEDGTAILVSLVDEQFERLVAP